MKSDDFKNFLSKRGLKMTRERQELYLEILKFDNHFDVDSLLFQLKNRGLKTSKATIYRTLQLLMEAGLIRNISLSVSEAHSPRYRVCSKLRAYDHLICTGCGKVIDFDKQEVCKTCHSVTAEHGYKLEAHSLRIFALCPDCQEKGLISC
jgi:Fur family ferric uptake transcriptional regulator